MSEEEFVAAALSNPVNAKILKRLPSLGARDAWLASGCLFQSAWNAICGFAAHHGILDYDLFYFDPDTSWDAEDAVIKRADQLFADIGTKIEVRNQARVHLWFEKKFGAPYPPLAKSTDGIDRFLMHNAMVGMNADGEVYAPHGFDDIANMIVRPNRAAPNFQARTYLEKTARWKPLWPKLTILPP